MKKSVFDGELSRIYSAEFSSTSALLAAGGHQGRVAVYGVKMDKRGEKTSENENDETGSNGGDVLFSFRAHGGWVSQVQFFSDQVCCLFVMALSVVMARSFCFFLIFLLDLVCAAIDNVRE